MDGCILKYSETDEIDTATGCSSKHIDCHKAPSTDLSKHVLLLIRNCDIKVVPAQ
jgi:hypothetical protein